MYNVLKMLDIETDFNGRPIEPPKIVRAVVILKDYIKLKFQKIVENPFPDVVPTSKTTQNDEKVFKEKKESIFKHIKVTKLVLLFQYLTQY